MYWAYNQYLFYRKLHFARFNYLGSDSYLFNHPTSVLAMQKTYQQQTIVTILPTILRNIVISI